MAGMDSGSRGLGAGCALHPAQQATGTCARCGNFMCDACGAYGTQTFCPTCRERTGVSAFPLGRDTWSFSALWDYCFEAFKREWVMLSLALVVTIAVSMVANLFGSIGTAIFQGGDSLVPLILAMILAYLVQVAVQGVMGMGMMRVVFDVLEGGRADVGRVFSQVHKVGRYVLATLIAVVVVSLPLMILFCVLSFVGLVAVGVPVSDMLAGGAALREQLPALLGVLGGAFLLTFIPAIYFGLPLYLLQAELTSNEDVTAVRAFRNCYVLARGERLSLFGFSLLAILLVLVGLMACFVGVIPATALMQLLLGGLYLALRNGSELDTRPR